MRTEKIKLNEGWTWLSNANKWHYFVNGRSLCEKWMLLFTPSDFETGNNDSPDNCATCKKRLAKHKPAGNGAGE